jgi:hypothetical protein
VAPGLGLGAHGQHEQVKRMPARPQSGCWSTWRWRERLNNREGRESRKMRGIAFMNGAVLALLEGTTGVILTVRYYR